MGKFNFGSFNLGSFNLGGNSELKSAISSAISQANINISSVSDSQQSADKIMRQAEKKVPDISQIFSDITAKFTNAQNDTSSQINASQADIKNTNNLL